MATTGDVIRRQPIAELAIDLLLPRIKKRIAAPQGRVLPAQLIVRCLRVRGGNIGNKPQPDHGPSRSFFNSSVFANSSTFVNSSVFAQRRI